MLNRYFLSHDLRSPYKGIAVIHGVGTARDINSIIYTSECELLRIALLMVSSKTLLGFKNVPHHKKQNRKDSPTRQNVDRRVDNDDVADVVRGDIGG